MTRQGDPPDDDAPVDDGATVVDPRVHHDPHAEFVPRGGERVDPREVVKRHATASPVAAIPEQTPVPKPAVRFDPHARIDDSSRTAKWNPNEVVPQGPQVVAVSHKERSGPVALPAARQLPAVKLRGLSEKSGPPPRGLGNLAPPRDPRAARSRQVRDWVLWGSVAVIVASIVTLIVWFAAR